MSCNASFAHCTPGIKTDNTCTVLQSIHDAQASWRLEDSAHGHVPSLGARRVQMRALLRSQDINVQMQAAIQ